MSQMDQHFWTPADFNKIAKAKEMPDLLSVAFEILNRMPDPIGMVAGPISTGGKGIQGENVRFFKAFIKAVQNSGEVIFNQLPFEDVFVNLSRGLSLT